MFSKGATVEQVAGATGRAAGTTWGYLAEYMAQVRPERLDAWIDRQSYRKISQAIEEIGNSYLKPTFDHLGGSAPYEHIRLVIAHRQAKKA
jgi:hypothetical protein